MSIANCIKSLGFEVNEDWDSNVDDLNLLLEQFEMLKQMDPTAELQGISQIQDYIQDYNEDNFDMYSMASLLSDSKPDFLHIDSEYGKGSRPTTDTNSSYMFGYTAKTEMPASEVLDNIKTRYPDLTPEVQEITDNMVNLLSSTNATVKLVPESRIPDGDFMQYDPNTNAIFVSKEKIDRVAPERAVTAMFHEIVHSVTVHTYIKSSKTPQEQEFRDLIDEMWAKYKGLTNVSDLSFNERQSAENYGFKQPEEFISEMMTNPTFQKRIKDLERGEQSLWDRFVAWINKMLGRQGNSDYQRIIDAITSAIITNSSNPTNEAEAMAFLSIAEDPSDMYDETTVSKKLASTLNTIKDTLEENIRRYDSFVKTSKDPKKTKKYADKLKEVLATIEQFDATRQWAAVAYYISTVDRSMKILNQNFTRERFDTKSILKTVGQYEQYISSFALINDMQDFLSSAFASDEELPINADEFIQMEETLKSAKGNYDALRSKFDKFMRKGIKKQLYNRKYAYEVIAKREEKYRKQHADLNMKEPVENYISRMMNEVDKEEIDTEVVKHIDGIIENPQFDITWATGYFNSGLNTNSKLVQLFVTIAGETRNNIIERGREKDFEMRDLFERFSAGKENMKMSELYKNIYEQDADGVYYIKGEYSIKFKDQYEKLKTKYTEDLEKAKSKYGANSEQYRKAYKDSNYKKWRDANTVTTPDGTIIPTDNWKNDMSKLSAVEKEVLDYFVQATKDTHKQTFGFRSLIQTGLGVEFYKMPSVTRSNLERVTEGKLGGILTDQWRNVSEAIRPDDVGYEQEKVDLENEGKNKKKSIYQSIGLDKQPIYKIRVNFRGEMKPNQQSLDLFTVYRLEIKNGINYEEKHNVESTLKMLVDISKHKEYFRSNGMDRIPILGKFIKRKKQLMVKGEHSKTYERMVSLMEQNVYDIMHKHAGKLGKLDLNKTVRVLNGYTAALGMTVNEVTAAANILNGKAQLFLEMVAGTFIKAQNLAKAEKIYFATLLENLKDMSSPVKNAFANQINEEMDTFGTVSVSARQGFIKNTFMKATMNGQSLQFMQEGGEHWLQSVLTMAIMDNIKVLNGKNQLINKEGNPVKESKDAASLLDMYYINSDGKLELHPKVVYTTKSSGVEYNKGGKEKIQALIKKKMFDTMGNYDPNMQPEAMRHWHGKLLMMYRKYLIPMGLARYRGFVHAGTATEDLEDYQRFYSEALQLHEEGFYTSTARYFLTSVIPALRKMQFDLMSKDWKALSDYEKANIYKTLAETLITFVVLPATAVLLEAGLQGGDDDDTSQKFMYFLLLQTRRLESELSAYRDPREQYRITSSPIPAIRTLENATNLIDRIMTPIKWGETYKAGERKGMLKFYRDIERLTPVLNQTAITYKEKYQYIQNMTQ